MLSSKVARVFLWQVAGRFKSTIYENACWNQSLFNIFGRCGYNEFYIKITALVITANNIGITVQVLDPDAQLWSKLTISMRFPQLHVHYSCFSNYLTQWQDTTVDSRGTLNVVNAPKPVGWMMCFLLMTFVPVQTLCVNKYIYIYYIYIYMLFYMRSVFFGLPIVSCSLMIIV